MSFHFKVVLIYLIVGSYKNVWVWLFALILPCSHSNKRIILPPLHPPVFKSMSIAFLLSLCQFTFLYAIIDKHAFKQFVLSGKREEGE